MPAVTRRGRLSARLAGVTPGLALSAIVVAAAGAIGVTHSDDPARLWNAVGHAGGFQMQRVTLTGQRETSDSAIVASVGLDPSHSLLAIDAQAVRERLVALPWVREATVRKILPGTLNVTIAEAEAAARWRLNGREMLVADDGTVLADSVPRAFRSLPLVAGRAANFAVPAARALLDEHPAVAERTTAAIYVNERRWDLRLVGGATVRLPQGDPSAALVRLASLEAQGAILASGPVVIDLRLPDRTTVELAPPEAEPGDEPQIALPRTLEAEDPLAAAIAEATASSLGDDPLARAIAEAAL